MPHRIVQWAASNVGRAALHGIIAHPQLELVGVWVHSSDKDGVDAGSLAGLDQPVGVTATTDAQALIDLEPDVVCYAAMADGRLEESIQDLCRLLRAGIDVVSSAPVFLQFPVGAAAEMAAPVREAAREGGASLFVNGIDPGFANDALPLAITGICERIDTIRCMEVLNYATYHQHKVLVDLMGFGRPLDEVPLLLQPGVLSLAGEACCISSRPVSGWSWTGSRSVTSGCLHRTTSRSPAARSLKAPPRACASNCRASSTGSRGSSTSTSPGCTTTWRQTGRSRPAPVATGSR